MRAFHLEVEVQGDAHQLVVDEGVVEAVLNGGSELFQILLVQRQGGDDLLMQHLIHKAADGIVVHAVTDDVEASQICAQNETGVCTIQDADLALLVGVTSGTTITLTPAFLNGSLSSRPAGPSMTHTPKTSPTSST